MKTPCLEIIPRVYVYVPVEWFPPQIYWVRLLVSEQHLRSIPNESTKICRIRSCSPKYVKLRLLCGTYAEDGKEIDKDLQRTWHSYCSTIKSFVWWHSRGRCHRGLLKLCNEYSKFNSGEIVSHLCTALDKHIGILSVSLSSHTSHYDRASRNTHSHSSCQHTLPDTRTYRSQTALGMCCS